jgi:polar amino acid transport system permease protein
MQAHFDIVRDNLSYLLWGAFPAGPLGGAALTLVMSLVAGAVSLIVGVAAGVLAVAAWHPLRWAVRFVLGFLRVIPPLLVIFWMYFLMPLLLGVDVPQVGTAIVALTLLSAAYIAVSVRAGILSIPTGQWQSGLSLGLTPIQTLRYVVLPQALRIMLPSFVNQLIALIKDTSLSYVIGVGELTYVASQVNNRTLVYPADIFAVVASVYFVLCFGLSVFADRLAKRMTGSRSARASAATLALSSQPG